MNIRQLSYKLHKSSALSFRKQKVNMLRRDDIALDTQLEAKPELLEGRLEDPFAAAPIETDPDEVGLSRSLKALQTQGIRPDSLL
jgi:hypothetical protein